MAGRSVRLAGLLRGFGLSPAELARKEPKLMVSRLRAQYFQMAKATHPDLAAAENKEKAQKAFVALREHFDEAQRLIEEGVLPSDVAATAGPQGAAFYDSPHQGQTRPMHTTWYYQHPPYRPNPKPEVEFSWETRMQGRALVISVVLGLCLFIREFGAAFAGTNYAWHPGSSVRRYGECINKYAEHQKREATKTNIDISGKEETSIERRTPSERGIDSFYQKRGISNTRKKYVPRGSDGVSMEH